MNRRNFFSLLAVMFGASQFLPKQESLPMWPDWMTAPPAIPDFSHYEYSLGFKSVRHTLTADNIDKMLKAHIKEHREHLSDTIGHE